MLNFRNTAVAALTTALLATSVSADSYFFNQMQIDDSSNFTIAGVTSDVDGQVVIFDYTGGEKGEILATAPVNQGANVDVVMTLSRVPSGDILAVLYEGEQTEGRGITNTVIDIDDM